MSPPINLFADLCPDRTPVVVAARRTVVASVGQGLATIEVVGLAAPVLRALAAELAGGPAVDDVLLGNCMGPGGDPARVAALAARLGIDVPGLTVDRQCGSGLEAVALAAERVALGSSLILAGGVESASTAPTRFAWRPNGVRQEYQRAPFAPQDFGDPGMGEAADAVARVGGVSRERQDDYAVRSHRLAVASQDAGTFADELVALGPANDDRPRPGLKANTLARFRPAFSPDGSVTVGNACAVSDGAAGVAVVAESTRRQLGLPGLAIRGTARVGTDPRLPGLGPVTAVTGLLSAAGLSMADVGVLEITEAFAAQVLACTDAWGLDPLGADSDRVCPQGGAIALGHPWGASGALLVVRLFSRMVRQAGPRYGIATCAIGGGQGIAVLVERVG